MLPSASFGPNVGLSWADRAWSYELRATWLVPRFEETPDKGGVQGAYLSFLGGQTAICWMPGTSQRHAICGGLELGDVMGKGVQVSEGRLGHGLWLAGTATGRLHVPISRQLRLELALQGAVPVLRPEFGFTGNDWRIAPKPWSFRFLTGICWP